jgi:hypothetical protein
MKKKSFQRILGVVNTTSALHDIKVFDICDHGCLIKCHHAIDPHFKIFNWQWMHLMANSHTKPLASLDFIMYTHPQIQSLH